MLRALPLPERPLRFLAVFSLAAALLLAVWTRLAGAYGGLLLQAVNLMGSWTGLPEQGHLAAPPDATLMGVGVVGAIALFLVTPRRDALWKALWIAAVVGVLLVAHVAAVTLQLHHAWAGPPGSQDGLDPTAGNLGERLFPAVMVLLWFAAGLRRAGTPGAAHPRQLD